MTKSNRAPQISDTKIERDSTRNLAGQRRRFRDGVALAAVMLLLLINGFAGSHYTQRLRMHTDLVEASHRILGTLDNLEYEITAVEAEQRGYLLTWKNEYLERYEKVISNALSTLKELTLLVSEKPIEIAQVDVLDERIKQKVAELSAAIEANRDKELATSSLNVGNQFGMSSLDAIRDLVNEIRTRERISMDRRETTASTTYLTSLVVGIVSTITGLLLVLSVVYLLQHNRRRAEEAADSISADHARLQASLERIRSLETDNLQLNQYVRSFVEQVEDYAIFAMDQNCRATTWNNGVLKVLGFRENEFIGQDIRNLIFVPEAIELGIPEAEFQAAAELGSASDDRWMMRKGGQRFWASGITSSVKDDGGFVVGYSKVMRDLTDKKRDEDELADLASRYSETNRRMGEFMATLAHELRNPLAPIRNALDLMAMSAISAEDEELRILMDRQVSQLIRLLDDLLDISRIGRGKIVLQCSVVDLRTCIESAIEASSMLIKEKGQELKLDLCQEEVWVNIDSARITQVASNLLNNASRYSDAGCVIRLSLKVDHKASESGTATMTIEDNGIGISSDRLNEIFQMFAQVDDSVGRGQAGLGIGLTLEKTLVELHRGSVVAESDGEGKGSLFTWGVCLNRNRLINHNTDRHDQKPEYQKDWAGSNPTNYHLNS